MAQPIQQTERTYSPASRPRELAMSAAWNAALVREVPTIDGRMARIVYHGSWSNGWGPDFKGAMIDFGDGHLVTGDIELHHRASDWLNHGHNLDANYNDVVLHVVSIDDLAETRCINGRMVPMSILQLPDEALFAIDKHLPHRWDELGGSVCAASLTKHEPATVRRAIHTLGDARLRSRATSYEPEILEYGADAVFLRELFSAFGYSANKAPMAHLGSLVLRYSIISHPQLLEQDGPSPWLAGVLLGMGGFLPLAPADAHAAGILPEDQYRIERAWQQSAAGFADDFVPANSWQLARVRPANHPTYRIMQLATLLARTQGQVLEELIDCVRSGDSVVAWLREHTSRPWHPGIGAGRATAIVSSVLLPTLLSIASIEEDDILEDAAMSVWVNLPRVEWTQPAKRALKQVTGGPTIRNLGERGHQGLLHLDRELCAPRNCSRCPIADAVLRSNTPETPDAGD